MSAVGARRTSCQFALLSAPLTAPPCSVRCAHLFGQTPPNHPPAGEGIDLFTLAFFGVFAGVFGNAVLKSLRKKREFRECRRMLAKLKRASAGAEGQAPVLGPLWLQGAAPRASASPVLCSDAAVCMPPARSPIPQPQPPKATPPDVPQPAQPEPQASPQTQPQAAAQGTGPAATAAREAGAVAQALRSRADQVVAEAPDLVVGMTEDGAPITARQELERIKREAMEGTDDTLGGNDAKLVDVAVQCALLNGE